MSILKQVINLRDKFSTYLDRSVNFANAITDEGEWVNDHFETIDDITCQTTLENYHGILTFKDSSNQILKRFDLSADYTDWDCHEKLLSEQVTSQYTVGDLLGSIGSSSDLYQSIGTILTKYSYANRISVSEIQMMISNVGNTDDVIKFKNALFQGVDENGYITSASFMSLLNSIYETNYDSLSSGTSFEVNTESPFKIASLFSFIVDSAPDLFSALLIATRGVVAVLLAVVVSIIKMFFTAISNILSSKITYDRSISNDYANAPIMALDSPYLNRVNDVQPVYLDWAINNHLATDRSVYLFEENGLAIFKWWNQHYSDFRFNGYDYPCFDPYKTMQMLLNKGFISRDSGNSIIINVNSTVGGYVWEEFLYTDQPKQWLESCKYDSLGYSPELEMEVLFSFIVAYFIRTNIEIARQGLNSGSLRTYASADLTIQAFNDPDEQVFQVPGSIVRNIVDDASYSADPRLLNNRQNYLNMYGYISDNWCKLVKDRFMRYNYNVNGEPTSPHPCLGYDDTSYYKWYMPFCSLLGSSILVQNLDAGHPKLMWSNDIQSRSVKADCLPQSFGVRYPEVIGSELATALIAFSLVVTAAAVTVGQIKKSIQKRMISKQALKASRINDLRNNFLNDPSNVQKRKDYENAVYSYNKWGAIFGWGHYDGLNGWFDSSSSNSAYTARNFASTISNQQTLDELIVSVRDLIKIIQ